LIQCFLTALKAESQPIIDYFNLEKDLSFSFPVYMNENRILIGLGVGKKNIEKRIKTVLKNKNLNLIQFINIGIAGGNSSTTKIGECYLLNQIEDEATKKTYYPDILIKHNFEEKSLVTVEKVISEKQSNYKGLVDMEASEIFHVCSSFVPVHRLVFIKIVSDHMNLKFEEIIALPISNMILHHMDSIESYLFKLEKLFIEEKPILNQKDFEWIQSTSRQYLLTKAQQEQLLHFSKGFRIRHQKTSFPNLESYKPISKTDRNLKFQIICEKLTS
jgi:nucleoside phosphorylase